MRCLLSSFAVRLAVLLAALVAAAVIIQVRRVLDLVKGDAAPSIF